MSTDGSISPILRHVKQIAETLNGMIGCEGNAGDYVITNVDALSVQKPDANLVHRASIESICGQ